MPIAVIVDWYGPYKSLDAIAKDAKLNWSDTKRALYMALGSSNKYRYVGLTTRPHIRIGKHHDKLNRRKNRKFFVGEIVTQGISGRRKKKTPPDLRLAEHALIRYLKPKLNERKKFTNPDDCVSIFSCFYSHRDYETVVNPLPTFPKLLAFNPITGRWSRSWR